MIHKNFDKEILLPLRRMYSKDETVALLNLKIKELEFEIGILKSDLSEAKEIKDQAERKTKGEWLKDDLIMLLEKEKQGARTRATMAEKSLKEYQNKYYSLLVRTQNNA